MAWTLGTAAAFTALLLACVLGSVSAGIQYTTGIEYPGFTGVIPAACEGGEDDYGYGSPSEDFELSQPPVVKVVNDNVPEQIHITQGVTPADMYISWATGDAVYTFCSDAQCGNATAACHCNALPPRPLSTQVKYSTDSTFATYSTCQDAGTYPVTNQYVQYYGPMATGNNYTSPLLHTCKLTGLTPSTQYFYQVGDGSDFSSTYSFTTLPAVGSTETLKIAVTADLGTTHATYEVLQRFTEGNEPDIVFLAGDHTYADNHDDDQRYWDGWFRMLQNSTSAVPWQVSLGNHEEETQWNQCIVNAFAAAGCGNLTAEEIAQNCGSPINSNSTICPVRCLASARQSGYRSA